jgi:phosphate transport system permease protein
MPASSGTTDPFSGGVRRTGLWIRLQDRAAEIGITVGGLTVLLAMLGICVFLVVSAAPLFSGGKLTGERGRFSLEHGVPAWIAIEPTFDRFLTLCPDGVYRVHRLSDGLLLADTPAFADGAAPVAIRVEAGEGWATLTRGDGSFTVTRGVLTWRPGDPSETGQPGDDLSTSEYDQHERDGITRRWTLRVVRQGPFQTGAEGVIDSRSRVERTRYFVAGQGSAAVAGALTGRRALGSSDIRWSRDSSLRSIPLGEGPEPRWVFASSAGRWVYALWESGRLAAFDTDAPDGGGTLIAELPWAGARITAAVPGLGAGSLIVGDSQGRISVWAVGGARASLRPTASSILGDSPVTAIRPGDRDRTIAAGFADGSGVLYNTLSDKRIVRVRGDDASHPSPVAAVAGSPGSDILMLVHDDGRAVVHGVAPGHTEVSFRSLFGRVPYEGYDEPAFVYQSTGAASSEPKFSLVPLIFGTMKATVFAMLFAVPLGVLAAIYSSEFLDHGLRRVVKPTIELMASLPSVVLGFMAAMVVAPFVRDHLPAIMVFAVTGPLAVVLAAHAWRLIPRDYRQAIGNIGQFTVIAVALLLGVLIAASAGGAVERALFAGGEPVEGAIRAWLNGDLGHAAPGWFVALLPVCVAVLLVLDSTVLDPFWRSVAARGGGTWPNLVELVRLAVNLLVAVGAAWAVAGALEVAGLDPRDSIFGPFNQRNTLVVGLIMGVAVIPIIYTISEDAIRSVPDSLRSASLGVGATPWQTAIRVILPVAGSGIFSACMIGLGRAVGETMIVLMATGNTPEISWNIFSGFRTLSANIAVELPEAPRASTHYRVLFLCGLVLFAMTLAINTTAELVRQHFRRRNAAL